MIDYLYKIVYGIFIGSLICLGAIILFSFLGKFGEKITNKISHIMSHRNITTFLFILFAALFLIVVFKVLEMRDLQ